MNENKEEQREKMIRQIRDQEVEKILAMTKEERKGLIDACLEYQKKEAVGASLGRIEVLAVDSSHPSLYRVKGGFGEHGLGGLEVQQAIIRKEGWRGYEEEG
ncbi:MAG: hypothetical protein N2259_02315 [Patescibacteria group bacterium]|nr:hypothetical protein [Patescibacteria group bacterium]